MSTADWIASVFSAVLAVGAYWFGRWQGWQRGAAGEEHWLD